jgi:2-polyprenyl-6-hydroxyphenyl methylase/3-demethylubiquinone-9 3-methyltransferase
MAPRPSRLQHLLTPKPTGNAPMASDRFAFGKNWKKYIEKHFSQERVDISKQHILTFLGMQSLEGKIFLDVGCGSGLHSFAALQAGAKRIVSFDYDIDSVEATRILHRHAGSPAHWTILQGSVLDLTFMESLELADIVYSWGVLHHTGDQWTAIRNAASRIGPRGLFYIALYTSDAYVDPPAEFWLDVKQRYIRSGWVGQRRLELWYIWRFQLNRSLRNVRPLLSTILAYKKGRGMSFYTDIKDWLGGWPMEFSSIADVKKFADQELGLELRNIKAGEANTEYLFGRRS